VLIDAYVADLGRTLRGPRRAKADLLREARDGLRDAAAAHMDAGFDPDTAERRAVADFGHVRDIAPHYQAELAAAQGRRTALLICLVLAPQAPLWQYVGGALAEGHRRARVDGYAAGYAVVDTMMSWLGGAALIGTLVAAAACGVGVRYLRDRRLAAVAIGYFAYAVAAVFVVAGLLMILFGPIEALSPAGVPMYLLCLVAPLAWVAWSGRRCIRASPARVAQPVTPDGVAARRR
jgi:hypothetical protein